MRVIVHPSMRLADVRREIEEGLRRGAVSVMLAGSSRPRWVKGKRDIDRVLRGLVFEGMRT